MFNRDFYPTPRHVIDRMVQGFELYGKLVLEPSAGKGNIVDYLHEHGANVIACEKEPDLRTILQAKVSVIADDFLTLTSDKISHIDMIIMNPPFTADEKHILHAYEIAPAGCTIIALCNKNTIENSFHNELRKRLCKTIDAHGKWEDLGACFVESERSTNVEVALVTLQKEGASYETEFNGFFLEEDEEEPQANGLMSYNVVRDLVNRYVAAIKIYDEQLAVGIRMNALLDGFYGEKIGFSCTEMGAPLLRNEFKFKMQVAGWSFIFDKMNMAKYATKGLKEDINKFVHQQANIPFTMRNIYHMLDLVVQTTSQRMDKALEEVFDWVTSRCDDNKYNVPGWKTNSHYLVGKKFIVDGMCYQDQKWYKGQSKLQLSSGDNFERIEDLVKALCYISGDNYDTIGRLYQRCKYAYAIKTDESIEFYDKYEYYGGAQGASEKLKEKGKKHEVVFYKEPAYGEVFEWAYFKIKAHKKGTMHFEFMDEELWGRFNQRIARIKGFPLFEPKKQTAYQDRQTGRAQQEKKNPAHQYVPQVLFSTKL